MNRVVCACGVSPRTAGEERSFDPSEPRLAQSEPTCTVSRWRAFVAPGKTIAEPSCRSLLGEEEYSLVCAAGVTGKTRARFWGGSDAHEKIMDRPIRPNPLRVRNLFYFSYRADFEGVMRAI